MPADDQYDVVHEKVKIKADEPYGCNSDKSGTSRSDGYWAMERTYYPDGRFTIAPSFIYNRMSTDCRNFYLWDTDQRCSGCIRPKDYEYADRMKQMT